jgi:hypothetical protein
MGSNLAAALARADGLGGSSSLTFDSEIPDFSKHTAGKCGNLIMVKADVALEGELKNITSVAAFKRAIEQRPDIIS